MWSARSTPSAVAQGGADGNAKRGGSPNVYKLAQLQLEGPRFTVGGVDVEQEMSRPYAYVSRTRLRSGLDIVSLKDPEHPSLIYSWRIEDVELHASSTGETGKYFKTKGRYYLARGFNLSRGKVQPDLSAVIFDVTGLPDRAAVKEVGRIRTPYAPGGFISVFAYKHSDGRVLLFGTNARVPAGTAPYASVYDMDKFLSGAPNSGMIAKVPTPETPLKEPGGYHDIHVMYDAVSKQDRLYGAGPNGFYVYDFTRPEEPRLLTSITGISGVTAGHTIIPSPDQRYVVTQMEYQFFPMMVFDLTPGLTGKVATISAPIGSWIADWRDLSHNHEVRWPYIFAAAYEDGLQIIDAHDPASLNTVGWYHTCECAHQTGSLGPGSVTSGAFELDVRNADGLIVVTDNGTGLWTFRLNGFNGWNGKDWNVPNSSSAQDWDRGPK